MARFWQHPRVLCSESQAIINLYWLTQKKVDLMFHSLQVGNFRCVVLSDGQMRPPWEPAWEVFFGPETGVPDDELREALQKEGEHREGLSLGYNCLYVETESQKILIDTGLGKHFTGYGPELEPHHGKLSDALLEAGIDIEGITSVILTHLHQDHSRGCIWSGELTFPNATYIVASDEVAFWANNTVPSELADHDLVAKKALSMIGKRLKTVEYDTEITRGVRIISAQGHTAGHIAVLLSSEGEHLLCVGDTFYDALQVRHPNWCAHYDLDPQQSITSRQRLLSWAVDNKCRVLAYHMPFPGLGQIISDGESFEWCPIKD